ncbi:hypothetical protein MBLNU13_g00813t2 [Cladosporium sp. NU13]
MNQPQRKQPSRTARAAPNTAPLTSPQFALCDVPRVLEHSTRRLEDFEQCAVTGPGILVKLFPVDDSNSTLWIVGSPHANKWIPSKMKEMRTANANAKAHDVAKVRKPSTHKTRTQLSSGHSVKQKKQEYPAQGRNKVTEHQVHDDQDESDDMSKEAEEDEEDEDEEEEEHDEEEEDEEHEEDEDEDDAVEDNDAQEQDSGGKGSGDADADAREDNVAGEQDAGEQDAGEQDTGEDDAAEDDAAKQDAGEQDAGEEDAGEEDAAKEDGEEEDNDAGGQDAGKDDAAEDGAAEDDAGKGVVGDLDNSEEGQDLQEGPKRDAVMDKENGHDAGEQEEDGNNEASDGTGNEDADDMEDKGYEGEEGLAESIGKEGEHEAEGQPEAEDQQEAEREGEREGKEVTGKEIEPHSEARGKDCEVHDDREDEHGGDWKTGIKQRSRGQTKWIEGNIGQRVNRKTGDTRSEEDDERCTTATGEEDTVEDGNGRTEEKRKRSSADSISEEHLNKRHKSGRDWNGVDTTTADSLDRTIGLKAQLRPQTPPLKSTTPSAPPTIELVRQTSVVSGLEDTESAVWDAARRDLIFCSLVPKDQRKLVCTAVSLGSDKGIKELQRFVYNARRDGKQKDKSLAPEFDLSVPQSDGGLRNADGTFISSDSGLGHFYALYQQIETLDKVAIKLSVTRRAKLAAMAQYRKAVVQNVAGRIQAKDAKLRLFHVIHPEHATIEKPDKSKDLAAAMRFR